MVKRELYLQKLIDFQNQPLIKVMAGMRRSGKSTLLAMFKEHLLSHGISPEAIIQLNFELMLLDPVEDYRQLYQLIKRKMQGKGHVYLLLDEIQLVQGWEKAVNSLFAEGQADIYLTGSNAGLLSSEISTLLSGRYVEIHVMPLSFREYLDFLPQQQSQLEAAFQQYLQYGGMPIIPNLPQKNEVIESVLAGIYDTVLMKDVVQRNALRDASLLENVVRFLADNAGNPVSTSKLSGYLTSKGRKTTAATIDSYLKMLTNAFIFYRAPRYDIKGKLCLKTQEKYYIVDNGIRNALLGFRGGDYGHVLENIVYMELLRRGYQVGVGKLGTLEVDFVAVKAEEKVYYQVAASVTDETTLQRELAPLQKIPDQYEKVLLTMDRSYIKDYDGIKNVNIIDFLLKDY